jgi:thiamine transport system substrate-binding protein
MPGRITLALTLFVALFAVACQPIGPVTVPASPQPAVLVLASHNSFNVSEAVVTRFEEEHNVQLEFLALGDAGEMVNRLVLSRDAPLADVVFGVDNTFLSRALNADIFQPYASPQLEHIPDELKLDPEHRLLPVDVGYVNLNADRIWFEERGVPLPQTLEDLIKPEYRGLLVAQNPATSSPGLAFLLTTVSYFGEDGYLDFWQALRENDVLITDGWSEAYFEHFTVGSGGSGARPLVVSYSTSPPADVLYATDGRTEPASVNINPPGGVFRQIEFVGILRGAKQPELAQAWIDFMLGPAFQEDMPLQMFVYPARPDAQLPELFEQFAEIPAEPAEMDAAAIEANREQWIEAWTNVVLR